MKQRRSPVVCAHPDSVGIGDLVVDPDEGASCCPVGEGAGLPVQSVALVLFIEVR